MQNGDHGQAEKAKILAFSADTLVEKNPLSVEYNRSGTAVGAGSVQSTEERAAGPSCFDCLTCKKVDECAVEDQVLFDSLV